MSAAWISPTNEEENDMGFTLFMMLIMAVVGFGIGYGVGHHEGTLDEMRRVASGKSII